MKKPDLDYGTLFSRNLGVLTEAQQDRIRAARVLILGDMGSGETLCTLLVRCGFERIALAGEGRYAPSDMNRQIGCFTDTIGRLKVEVMADEATDASLEEGHPNRAVGIAELAAGQPAATPAAP